MHVIIVILRTIDSNIIIGGAAAVIGVHLLDDVPYNGCVLGRGTDHFVCLGEIGADSAV